MYFSMDDRYIKSIIPLASTNGCPIPTTSFPVVSKGKVMENGNLEMEFSDDLLDKTHWTDDKECKHLYSRHMVDMNEL